MNAVLRIKEKKRKKEKNNKYIKFMTETIYKSYLQI